MKTIFRILAAAALASCLTASAQVVTTNTTVSGAGVLPSMVGITASIGGGALLAGACVSGTVAVANSTTAMAVVAAPNTYPGDGTFWFAYVSVNGTVTVKVCGSIALTPTSSTYNIRVIQ